MSTVRRSFSFFFSVGALVMARTAKHSKRAPCRRARGFARRSAISLDLGTQGDDQCRCRFATARAEAMDFREI